MPRNVVPLDVVVYPHNRCFATPDLVSKFSKGLKHRVTQVVEAFTEGRVGCGEANSIEEAIEEATGIAGKEDYADSTWKECGFTVSKVE